MQEPLHSTFTLWTSETQNRSGEIDCREQIAMYTVLLNNQCLSYDQTYSSSAFNIADRQCIEKLLKQGLKSNGCLPQKHVREEPRGNTNYSHSNPKSYFAFLVTEISPKI